MPVSDKLFTQMDLATDFSASISGGVVNGDPGVVFTRADSSPTAGRTSYIKDGRVVFVTANIARFTGSRLIYELTSINGVEDAIDFTTDFWNRVGINILPTTEPSPNGSPTASRVQSTTTSANLSHFADSIVASENDVVTSSWFIAEGTSDRLTLSMINAGTFGTDGRVDINWVNGVPVTSNITGTVEIIPDLINGFFRVELTTTLVGGDTTGYTTAFYPVGNGTGGTANEDTIVWGIQGEANDGATTFINSVGAATTRASDQLKLAANTIPPHGTDMSVGITTVRTAAGLKLNSDDFRIKFDTGASDTYLRGTAAPGSSIFVAATNLSFLITGTIPVADAEERRVITLDFSTAVSLYLDRIVDGTPTAGAIVGGSAISDVFIGTNDFGEALTGSIADLRIYTGALTADEARDELGVGDLRGLKINAATSAIYTFEDDDSTPIDGFNNGFAFIGNALLVDSGAPSGDLVNGSGFRVNARGAIFVDIGGTPVEFHQGAPLNSAGILVVASTT